MSDAWAILAAWAAGGAMGLAFFLGLWWTVARAVASPRAALWLVGSLAARVGLLAGGSYLVGAGRWERYLACGLGVLMARPVVTRLTRGAREGDDAPHP